MKIYTQKEIRRLLSEIRAALSAKTLSPGAKCEAIRILVGPLRKPTAAECAYAKTLVPVARRVLTRYAARRKEA